MESRNPVFSTNEGFRRGGYATFSTPSADELQGMYETPSATALHTGRMTLDDVVVRTATIFGVLLAAAAAMFFVVKPGFGLVIGSALAAMVLGLVISFSKTVRPALILAYGALEGVFVGGISYWYTAAFRNDGLVPQAVLGTLAAFATMLVLYKTGVIRNSPRFQKIMLIAVVGYVVFGLVNLVVALTVGNSVYGISGLGLVVAGVGVVLASLSLVLDFDQIEQGVRNGLPRQYAWTAAFGLVVTLVWLYLEILRLLAILQSDN